MSKGGTIRMENKTQEPKPQETTPKAKGCRFCGFITPFDPDTPGYCCPFCGGVTFAPKEKKD